MKMAKKFLAVALAGVLALSVLTGCGNSANTKSIAEAMSDISKAAGITFKEDTKLNTKAKAIAEELAKADGAGAAALADDNTDGTEEIEAQKAKIMAIMGDSYKDQFVWLSATETKGYNATAQAASLLDGMDEGKVNVPTGEEPANTRFIGTTTVTQDGTTYRVAVITAAPEVKEDSAGGDTNQGSKE